MRVLPQKIKLFEQKKKIDSDVWFGRFSNVSENDTSSQYHGGTQALPSMDFQTQNC